jgi:mannose-1-phosphate guanylyltransferase / mannose-6-phosphate isomerase
MEGAMKIVPVILCGGSGTRLWPLSRKSTPKQFAPLLGEQSLFQAAALRLQALSPEPPVVVTGSDYRFIVKEQLDDAGISGATVLVEPEGRNTAPAVLAAALQIAKSDPDAVLAIMPSDHVVPDAADFAALVQVAAKAAKEGRIVTFGITPDRPETGYGWLEAESALTPGAPAPLKSFVEKPALARAESMLAAGNFLWNAGVFVLSAKTAIAAYRTHQPDMLAAIERATQGETEDLGFLRLDPAAWNTVENISVDFAIMERVEGLLTIPYSGRWSDLGDWGSVWREFDKTADGVMSHGSVTDIGSSASLLWSEDELELVGIGLKDVIAVAVDGAVLVADRSRSQEVKDAVAKLKAKGVRQAETASRDLRPWGWYETLALESRFQVKRIVVKPGAALSLQSHVHRAEHWIVVEGTARVTIGDEVKLVSENQSVYVPLGTKHRLENPGKVPMVLIEVQTGSYLGEDDIIRYEDVYARGGGAKG